MRPQLLLLALTLAATGCLQRPIGHFGEGAFYHARGHYRIRTGETATPLPTGWTLENYEHDALGRPTTEHTELTQIDLSELTGRRAGRTLAVPAVDLRFVEEHGRGEIWVRTVVLPNQWHQASAADVLSLWASMNPDRLLGPRHRGLVTPIHSGRAVVDGLPAHWVELDVIRGETQERVTVVAVRPRHHRYRWHRRQSLPMALTFAFASPPEEHESVRRDFEQLVARVDIPR